MHQSSSHHILILLQTMRDSFSFLLERSKTQAVLSFVADLAKEGKVRNLGYPIPVVGQSTASAGQQVNVVPIGIEMYIPTFIIHWNPSPEIGWWDAVPSSGRPHLCISIMHVVWKHHFFLKECWCPEWQGGRTGKNREIIFVHKKLAIDGYDSEQTKLGMCVWLSIAQLLHNQEEQCWQTTGITDIVHNGHTHKLTFQTIHAKPHAIIQVLLLHPIFQSNVLLVLSHTWKHMHDRWGCW